MSGGVYFTSDLHFGHRLVAKHRGFGDDTEAHDQAIIEGWSKVVRPEDHVWVLGDLSVGHFEHPLRIIKDLPGHKHLIAGNHDACHPMHREAHKHQRHYFPIFDSVQAFARRRINGEQVLLSHFPYPSVLSPVLPGPEWRATQHLGYFANADGQIRGKFGRVLKPWLAGADYEYVAISGPDGTRNSTVHSMVCSAFHGERPEGKEVAHNDGDKSNNRASNLRWATRQENLADQRRHETFDRMQRSQPGESNPRAKLTWPDVRFIRESRESVRELMLAFAVSESTIRSVQAGDTWREPRPDYAPGRDRAQPRYMQYRLPNHGEWLLHGHTHGPERREGREIHVGVDAWDLKPVSINAIVDLMREETSV